MRRLKVTVMICLALSGLLCCGARAADIEAEQREAVGVEDVESALPGEAGDVLGDATVEDSLDVESGISKIIDAAKERLGGIIRSGLKSASVILTVVILCSLAGSVYDTGAVPNYIPLGGALAIAAVASGTSIPF
jgi:hypothetical protein